MKKILIPCDFSEPAIHALDFAVDLAKASGGELTLLHVVELPVMHDTLLMPTLSMEESFLKETKAHAEKQFDVLKKKHAQKGVTICCDVVFGPVATIICSYVEENNMEMVVMGSHGASGIKELFVGSNAEKVVRNASVPVITTKSDTSFSDIKTIVFPMDLEWRMEQLVGPVRAFQSLFDQASIHFVYINTPAAFRRDETTLPYLENLVREGGFERSSVDIYNDLDEPGGIQQYAKRKRADMVLMVTHKKRGLAHFFTGSLVQDVVNHVECPIYTFGLT